MPETHETRTASVRRAPKYGAFIGLGAVVGLLVTVVATTAFPADPEVGMVATVGYMSVFGVSAGAALGAVAALIADRVGRRRATVVEVERGVVETLPEPSAEAVAPASDADDAVS